MPAQAGRERIGADRERRGADRERRAFILEPETFDTVERADPVEALRVRAALGRLPDEQREAINFAYYQNLSQTQIAQRLGIPLGTVKGRVALAMRKLRAELAEAQA